MRQAPLMLLLCAVFGFVGAGMLAVAYGGFADEWLVENVDCGSGSSSDLQRCEPGEAEAVLGPLGAAFAGIALLVGLIGTRSERRSARRAAARTSAPAVVIELRQHARRFGRVEVMSGRVRVRLRVDPPGGLGFEAWIRCSALGAPAAGDAVTVRFDPARPDAVFVDGL